MQHCSHAKDFFSIFKKKAWVPWCRYKMANIFVPIQLSILFQLLLKKKVVATIIPNPPSIFKFIMSFNLFSFWLCMQYLLLDVNKQTINTLWKIGDVILMIRIMRVLKKYGQLDRDENISHFVAASRHPCFFFKYRKKVFNMRTVLHSPNTLSIIVFHEDH
jgi:hypothetical protein